MHWHPWVHRFFSTFLTIFCFRCMFPEHLWGNLIFFYAVGGSKTWSFVLSKDCGWKSKLHGTTSYYCRSFHWQVPFGREFASFANWSVPGMKSVLNMLGCLSVLEPFVVFSSIIKNLGPDDEMIYDLPMQACSTKLMLKELKQKIKNGSSHCSMQQGSCKVHVPVMPASSKGCFME